MGKKFNKFVAFALAAAMMIPMCGIGAKAETKETEISLAERLTIRAIQKGENGSNNEDLWSGKAVIRINDDVTKNSSPETLYDGEPKSTFNHSKSRAVIIDIRDIDVSKVEIYNPSNSALAIAPLVLGEAESEITQGKDYSFATGLRLNSGSTTDGSDNTIYTVTDPGILGGDFLFLENSKLGNNGTIGEIKVYGSEKQEPDVQVEWTTDVSTNANTIRFLASFDTASEVTAASIALVNEDGYVTFSTTTEKAFYADITDVNDSTAYTAKPYVIIDGKGYFANAITATTSGITG